jgi:hypothetical protein
MRKVIFCLAACIAAGPGAFAQAGIRTEHPQGMFHVDALSNTQGNLNTADDVIVTHKGNLAIGLIPSASADTVKLTVADGGTPAAPKSPLRIIDGNQAEGRVLTSADASGHGHWADLPAGFNLGEAYAPYVIPAGISVPASGNNSFSSSLISFQAKVTGYYAFEVRWWARLQSATLGGTDLYQHFRLLRAGSVVDEFEAYNNTIGGAQDYCTISFTLYGQATAANQTFTLQVRAATPLQTETNAAWVNIVRMN